MSIHTEVSHDVGQPRDSRLEVVGDLGDDFAVDGCDQGKVLFDQERCEMCQIHTSGAGIVSASGVEKAGSHLLVIHQSDIPYRRTSVVDRI